MVTSRPYAGPSDLQAVLRFVQRIWSLRSRWHIGGLAWNLAQDPQADPERPMALWESGGAVLAWGWLRRPGGLSLLVDPGRPELVDDVLDWAGGLADEPLTVRVVDTEDHLVAALRRHGYAADLDGTFFLAHHRSLRDLPPPPELPDGFVVRSVRVDAEVPRRAGVHREVWHPSSLTDERYRALTRQWPYRPEFDMVVEAPDGRFAAYCLGWYDEVNRVGEMEPVGTLAEFRRLGLARAASIAVLRAFRAAGGETALVYSRGDDGYPIPRQVYAALGFTPHARTVAFSVDHERVPEPPRR